MVSNKKMAPCQPVATARCRGCRRIDSAFVSTALAAKFVIGRDEPGVAHRRCLFSKSAYDAAF